MATDEPVGYHGLHRRIRKALPLTGRCEHCGRTDRYTEHASRDHVYTEDPADWLELCRSCHITYDGRNVALAEKLRGRTFTPEHRAAIGAAQIGNQRRLGSKASPETLAKMSEGHRGIRPSEETRAKLRAAALRREADRRARLAAARPVKPGRADAGNGTHLAASASH